MAQPESLKKFKRHMSTAERELKRAVERTADCPIDFLPGHKKEMARRVTLLRDTIQWGIDVLEGKADIHSPPR